jgi:hypothetical protein
MHTFRREPADQVLPAGIWRIRLAPDGVISVEDPGRSSSNRFGDRCADRNSMFTGSWRRR